ncbi:MAG: hypothetical protein ABIJ97_03085 [Bacteroidota bacterium]
MSEHNKKVDFFGVEVNLDSIYYVHHYPDKRELTKKDRSDYDRIQIWPEQWRIPATAMLDPVKHPKINPMTGRQLIESVEKGFLPVFDENFSKNHKLMFIPCKVAEFLFKNKLIKKL